MIEQIWIDKQGGRHYHLAGCPMVVKDQRFHYEPIRMVIRKQGLVKANIRYEGKAYIPCPGCFGKSIARVKLYKRNKVA